jgi:hypothetical protein
MVRSEFSNGAFVTDEAASIRALGFADLRLFPGFGPIERFRHSISPVISYSYAGQSTVSDEFLRATNQTRQGYIASQAQNVASLTLSTNIEAKMRAKSDTAVMNRRRG